MEGKLSVKSFKSEDVILRVERRIFGKVTECDPDTDVEFLSHIDDTEFFTRNSWYSYWPWYWYHANTCSKLTWEQKLEAGKTAEFEYDYFYYEY